jgi:protein-disulfide isomerase
MMTTFTRLARLAPIAFAAITAAAGCTQRDTIHPSRDVRDTHAQGASPTNGKKKPGPAGPNAGNIVAEVAGTPITLGSLDAELEAEIASARAQYEAGLFELRSNALDQKVSRLLLEAEAKRREITVEALLDVEIAQKSPAPTDAEVRAFYDENSQQMEGATFEQIGERIREYLVDQSRQTRTRELMASLRKTHGAKVLLQPPRVEIEAKGPAKGPANAKINIVIFSDFECPFCARALPALEEVERTYSKDVRFFFRHSPLPFHQAARPAHEASSCAGEQGRFWEVHDHIFKSGELAPDLLRTFVSGLSGVDMAAYDTCMASGRGASTVEADLAAAAAAQVDGTPAFFINGIKLSGAQPFSRFQDIIEAELAR